MKNKIQVFYKENNRFDRVNRTLQHIQGFVYVTYRNELHPLLFRGNPLPSNLLQAAIDSLAETKTHRINGWSDSPNQLDDMYGLYINTPDRG